MIVIRNVFQLKFGKAREAVALMKKGRAIETRVMSGLELIRERCGPSLAISKSAVHSRRCRMRASIKPLLAPARMRQAYCFAVVAVALVVIIGGTALAQSDTSLGNWRLNLAKSKYDPGPPPMSETRIYEPWETDGVKATHTRVQADGTRVTVGFSAHYDGKDYKYTGSPDYDTIALKRVDANTIEAALKKGGKVVQTTKAVVSSNGQVRTITYTGTNAKGQKVNNVAIFDKQ